MNPCINCLRLQFKRDLKIWLVSQRALKNVLRNGSLFVECATENHSRNVRSKILCNVPIHVSLHVCLNTSKGVRKLRYLEGVSEEICENLSSQGVVSVRRVNLRKNNELVPTNSFILTFKTPSLPHSVKAGYLNIPVVPYIPNPCNASSVTSLYMGKLPAR